MAVPKKAKYNMHRSKSSGQSKKRCQLILIKLWHHFDHFQPLIGKVTGTLCHKMPAVIDPHLFSHFWALGGWVINNDQNGATI